jgi:hypothetical protein
MTTRVAGGCHCGAVQFAALVREDRPEVLDCNCSICAKTGFLHLIIGHEDFELLAGREDLESYRFGSGTANHLFCSRCGIKSFYQPRSHPDAWSVNFRALDPGHGIESRIVPFDGRNWEQAKSAL